MDDDAQSVVTMTGRVAQEGPYRPKAAALPVQTRDGVTKVDAVHANAVIRPLRPTKGEALKRRPRFKAIVRHIRARNSAVYFVVRGFQPRTHPGHAAQDPPSHVPRHPQVASAPESG
jgi:hypothetical protein